uniref:Coiled-coil domain-containing protein 86 n=1 Tax=Schistosoma mansoni TaxID=6183 RepID=A0A5K4EAB8_SCHMA
MKQGQTKDKGGTIRKTSKNDSKKEKEQNTKKNKFYELIARQKQMKNVSLIVLGFLLIDKT